MNLTLQSISINRLFDVSPIASVSSSLIIRRSEFSYLFSGFLANNHFGFLSSGINRVLSAAIVLSSDCKKYSGNYLSVIIVNTPCAEIYESRFAFCENSNERGSSIVCKANYDVIVRNCVFFSCKSLEGAIFVEISNLNATNCCSFNCSSVEGSAFIHSFSDKSVLNGIMCYSSRKGSNPNDDGSLTIGYGNVTISESNISYCISQYGASFVSVQTNEFVQKYCCYWFNIASYTILCKSHGTILNCSFVSNVPFSNSIIASSKGDLIVISCSFQTNHENPGSILFNTNAKIIFSQCIFDSQHSSLSNVEFEKCVITLSVIISSIPSRLNDKCSISANEYEPWKYSNVVIMFGFCVAGFEIVAVLVLSIFHFKGKENTEIQNVHYIKHSSR